ncbi:MAG: hypothetical protein LIO78_04080 [Clostridiales bacterium]|nr:hypothetical protein [Clostridiales bacterium]
MKRVYNLRVGGQDYRLRLTLGGQKRLKERFAEETLQTVLSAAGDGECMAALLGEALSWEGSGNPITDGEAFYDLLVDCGYAGQEAFGGLAFDIAACSGLISEGQARMLKKTLAEAVDQAFQQVEHGTLPQSGEPEEEARPMTAAG